MVKTIEKNNIVKCSRPCEGYNVNTAVANCPIITTNNARKTSFKNAWRIETVSKNGKDIVLDEIITHGAVST